MSIPQKKFKVDKGIILPYFSLFQAFDVTSIHGGWFEIWAFNVLLRCGITKINNISEDISIVEYIHFNILRILTSFTSILLWRKIHTCQYWGNSLFIAGLFLMSLAGSLLYLSIKINFWIRLDVASNSYLINLILGITIFSHQIHST